MKNLAAWLEAHIGEEIAYSTSSDSGRRSGTIQEVGTDYVIFKLSDDETAIVFIGPNLFLSQENTDE